MKQRSSWPTPTASSTAHILYIPGVADHSIFVERVSASHSEGQNCLHRGGGSAPDIVYGRAAAQSSLSAASRQEAARWPFFPELY